MSSDEEYWQKAGKNEPYWAVLSQPKYESAVIDDARKEEFFAEGERDVLFARSLLTGHFGEFESEHALDFGCGVGRLTGPISKLTGHVTGVDVSAGMRLLATQHLSEAGITNFTITDSIPQEELDWINSYIVFQHIRPALGVQILRSLLSQLKLGGVITMQFAIYRDGTTMHRVLDEVSHGRFDGQNFIGFASSESGQMPVYEYDLSELFMIFHSFGINALYTHHLNHGGTHGIWLVGKKTA